MRSIYNKDMGRIYLQLPKYVFNIGINNVATLGEPTPIVEADCVTSLIDLLMPCSFIKQIQMKKYLLSL